jgi:hypothetical protein
LTAVIGWPRHISRAGGGTELVQIDGSEHPWFEDRGETCTLLAFVDDATGRLMQLRFVASESGLSVICVQEVPLSKLLKSLINIAIPSANQLKYWPIQLFPGSPGFCPSNERFPDGRILVR